MHAHPIMDLTRRIWPATIADPGGGAPCLGGPLAA